MSLQLTKSLNVLRIKDFLQNLRAWKCSQYCLKKGVTSLLIFLLHTLRPSHYINTTTNCTTKETLPTLPVAVHRRRLYFEDYFFLVINRS